ncbi:unnamed protein product [Taenia asiatica]|uniref:Uncharacterized protein n=1 Tax=Taenia asiatica TaxID=60517 RepID=A0A0R3VWK8_TAEAS|nr:unnamed protein product [Taenia asiatica]
MGVDRKERECRTKVSALFSGCNIPDSGAVWSKPTGHTWAERGGHDDDDDNDGDDGGSQQLSRRLGTSIVASSTRVEHAEVE